MAEVASGSEGVDYLLFAMGLRLRTLDYNGLNTTGLVDGPDDKKVDFFDLDRDSGIATVAQSFVAPDWTKEAPPSNKAADLNTAVAWLLEADLDEIPRPEIRAAAEQLRDALAAAEITRVDVLFVHNLNRAANVDSELGAVRRTLNRLLERYDSGASGPPEGRVEQVSIETVEEWLVGQHESITVQDEVVLESLDTPVRRSQTEWEAVVATIRGADLVDLHSRFGEQLSSANVRDYLGSRESARNINRQIEKTARDEPGNFWVYNNGITILTRGVEVDETKLTLDGLAIINGAQTTGSLAQAAAAGGVGDAEVLARIIRCNDPSLVDSVIRFNNTQNPVKPWELRVIDPVQKQIREEFDRLGLVYQLRRGAYRRKASDIHSDRLGPFLAAFYGDPLAAHKNKADLYENESLYRGLFDQDTHVKNLLFIYRLGQAVGIAKAELRDRVKEGKATGDEQEKLALFRYGAFAFATVFTCAEIVGLWMEEEDARYRRRVTLEDDILLDQDKSEALLAQFVGVVLDPINAYLADKDAYQELKTQAGIAGIARHAKLLVQQVAKLNPDNYKTFTDPLTLVSD